MGMEWGPVQIKGWILALTKFIILDRKSKNISVCWLPQIYFFFIQWFWNCTSVSRSMMVVNRALMNKYMFTVSELFFAWGKPYVLHTCKSCTRPFILQVPKIFLQLFTYDSMKCSQLCRRQQLRPMRHSRGRQETQSKNNVASLLSLWKMPRDLSVHRKCHKLWDESGWIIPHTQLKLGWCFAFQVSSTHGSPVFQNGVALLCHPFVSEVTGSTSSFTMHRGRLALLTQPWPGKPFCFQGLLVPDILSQGGSGSE